MQIEKGTPFLTLCMVSLALVRPGNGTPFYDIVPGLVVSNKNKWHASDIWLMPRMFDFYLGF